jgi:D-beta-D-heptose 7-phosphate kinase/D-beta-D-heptose 1-phosphate adenosyltransferase
MRTGEMSKDKILDKTKLKDVITKLKKESKKIVFTNGCFDLIHVGHIRYLEEARKLGDILVIGLNSDKSVQKIKSGRPIIPEEQRAEVLSALYMVDYMTLFDEDTPYQLIKDLQPDILVKGADWEKKDIIGSDIVKEVHTIPFVKGISTSEIIKRTKKL